MRRKKNYKRDDYAKWVSTPEGREEYNQMCRKHQSTPGFKKYNAEQQRKRLKDPLNHRCHKITTFASKVFKFKGMKPNCEMGELDFYTAYNIIEFYSEAKKNDLVVNHIIPVKWLLQFDFDIPMKVIFDRDNMEVVTKAVNSQLGDIITEKAIKVATRLQKKYGIEGLRVFLSKIRKQQLEEWDIDEEKIYNQGAQA